MMKKDRELRKEFVKQVKWLWNNPDGHFWIHVPDKGLWITGEMQNEDGEDTISVYLTDKIDSLGYTFGRIFMDAYIHKDATAKDVRKYFESITDWLEEKNA